MLFNSIEYLLFLPIVVILHFLLPHRFRWTMLLAASYFFYMRWNAVYIVLIIASTLVDYLAGLGMAHTPSLRGRRVFLLMSLFTNLGLLFTFKYWNFFNDTAVDLFARIGLRWEVPHLRVLLPVGISFYTFQTLSYTIDRYRGKLETERHLGRFALYVAFFPQLVAGPIERARNLLPQFDTIKKFDWNRVTSGLQLILWGLFKKVVIADRLALYVDAVYNNVPAHGSASFLLATYFFAFQIYCDFSGYSDIAIGSAKVLGFDIMQNFRWPYFATSITDFWRRWHISLSSWLRDYLYIPLGGNRFGVRRTYVNLMITMLLGGLWHGASWNFVIWGGLQGLMLSVSRATLPAIARFYDRTKVPRWVWEGLRMVGTFHLVCLSWVFFRAATLSDAWRILTSFFGPWAKPFVDPLTLLYGGAGILVLLVVQVLQVRFGSIRQIIAAYPMGIRWACWYGLAVSIVLLGVDGGSQFIYFQF